MLISITGTPGTGKTTIGKLVAKSMGARLITTGSLVRKYKIPTVLDRKRKTKIIDTKKLAKSAEKESKKYNIMIFEGHLSHFARADFTFVLRTSPIELERRLKKKGWSREKIRENVEAEALGIIPGEAKNAIEIDTTKESPQHNAEEIFKIINSEKIQNSKRAHINWTKEYVKYLSRKNI